MVSDADASAAFDSSFCAAFDVVDDAGWVVVERATPAL